MNWEFTAHQLSEMEEIGLNRDAMLDFGSSIIAPSGEHPWDVFVNWRGLPQQIQNNEILENAGFWSQKVSSYAGVFYNQWSEENYGRQNFWAETALRATDCSLCLNYADNKRISTPEKIVAAADVCGMQENAELPYFVVPSVSEIEKTDSPDLRIKEIISAEMKLSPFNLGAFGLADIWNGKHLMLSSRTHNTLIRFAGWGATASVDMDKESLRIEQPVVSSYNFTPTGIPIEFFHKRLQHFEYFTSLARDYVDSSFAGVPEIVKDNGSMVNNISSRSRRRSEVTPDSAKIAKCVSHHILKLYDHLEAENLLSRLEKRILGGSDIPQNNEVSRIFASEKKLNNLKQRR